MWGTLQVPCRRPAGRAALQRYATGLLTELPPKNCDTIAQAVPGPSAPRLQAVRTTLEELAGSAYRRYAVELCHEEAKGEVGRDQYQGRRWPGFPRQAVTVMLAASFLVGLELRQRRSHTPRGRPRVLFPPAGSPEADATGSPSRGRWLRHQAVQWWVTTDRFIELCSRRL